MTEVGNGQKADPRPKKHLWFGYGNYSAHPNLQIGGGSIRDPDLFAMFFKPAKKERSPMTFFIYVAVGLIGLMGLVMLFAWGLLLFLK
jgi:hypothetical protein